jgi:glycosyltransferase involved in cell wall biosynthesis
MGGSFMPSIAAARGERSQTRSVRGMRLLVVSHPAVLPVNQEVYAELAERGAEVTLVVPARWRNEYRPDGFAPTALPGLEGRLVPLRVAFAGRQQRHFHLANPLQVIADARPDVAFLEAEPFAVLAAQWAPALAARGVAFGVQCDENLDRPLPAPVRACRGLVLRRAAFVAARSETAGRLVRSWGARGRVELVPHAVPAWALPPAAPERPSFTIGYAGRLVAAKGLHDLLAAVRRLASPVELVLFGDGELRRELDGQSIPGSHVRVRANVRHEQMASAYAQMDVLVLPSISTPTWTEQFGRAIVEALWCGVPVIGSDSGEIPWVIGATGGGIVFPEGDIAALAGALERLRSDPAQRARLAGRGRAAVERMFGVAAVAERFEALLRATARAGR